MSNILTITNADDRKACQMIHRYKSRLIRSKHPERHVIERIQFVDSPITNRTVAKIARQPFFQGTLKFLDLSRCFNICDGMIPGVPLPPMAPEEIGAMDNLHLIIGKLEQLEHLDLRGSQVSAYCIEKIKMALPNCQVWFRNN